MRAPDLAERAATDLVVEQVLTDSLTLRGHHHSV
jgi:hypothetical protein